MVKYVQDLGDFDPFYLQMIWPIVAPMGILVQIAFGC